MKEQAAKEVMRISFVSRFGKRSRSSILESPPPPPPSESPAVFVPSDNSSGGDPSEHPPTIPKPNISGGRRRERGLHSTSSSNQILRKNVCKNMEFNSGNLRVISGAKMGTYHHQSTTMQHASSTVQTSNAARTSVAASSMSVSVMHKRFREIEMTSQRRSGAPLDVVASKLEQPEGVLGIQSNQTDVNSNSDRGIHLKTFPAINNQLQQCVRQMRNSNMGLSKSNRRIIKNLPVRCRILSLAIINSMVKHGLGEKGGLRENKSRKKMVALRNHRLLVTSLPRESRMSRFGPNYSSLQQNSMKSMKKFPWKSTNGLLSLAIRNSIRMHHWLKLNAVSRELSLQCEIKAVHANRNMALQKTRLCMTGNNRKKSRFAPNDSSLQQNSMTTTMDLPQTPGSNIYMNR